MHTREQQDATRELHASQARWLKSYGWREVEHGRWTHPTVPARLASPTGTYTRKDAMTLTEAEPLAFGSSVRR
jgi:hypothetical protein